MLRHILSGSRYPIHVSEKGRNIKLMEPFPPSSIPRKSYLVVATRRCLFRMVGHLRATFCAALLVSATGSGAFAEPKTYSLPPIDDAARMRLAADQLLRQQLPSGLFPYDYDFATGAAEDMNDMSGPNIVRQTGTSFVLGEYLVSVDSVPLRGAITAALKAFDRRSLPIGKSIVQTALEKIGVYNRWRFWMSWRKPLNSLGLLYSAEGNGAVVSANGTYERAWSGATALALIAELKYRAVTGDEQFSEARTRWLRGLLALHVPGRGFREAPHYLTESAYVNGEAWLALGEYARAFPNDQKVAKLLAALDDYLITRYGARPSLMFYHWGVMAAEVRADTTGDRRFIEFIRDQTAWIISTQHRLLEDPSNSCALVEGLATAFRMLRNARTEASTLLGTLLKWITVMMQRNRTMQILPEMSEIKLDDGRRVKSERLSDFAGAFLVSSTVPKTQIDVTGHCLSALIRMQRAGLALAL